MKITKTQLKQIIKEELAGVLAEDDTKMRSSALGALQKFTPGTPQTGEEYLSRSGSGDAIEQLVDIAKTTSDIESSRNWIKKLVTTKKGTSAKVVYDTILKRTGDKNKARKAANYAKDLYKKGTASGAAYPRQVVAADDPMALKP